MSDFELAVIWFYFGWLVAWWQAGMMPWQRSKGGRSNG